VGTIQGKRCVAKTNTVKVLENKHGKKIRHREDENDGFWKITSSTTKKKVYRGGEETL